jgi:hypothetical protein
MPTGRLKAAPAAAPSKPLSTLFFRCAGQNVHALKPRLRLWGVETRPVANWRFANRNVLEVMLPEDAADRFRAEMVAIPPIRYLDKYDPSIPSRLDASSDDRLQAKARFVGAMVRQVAHNRARPGLADALMARLAAVVGSREAAKLVGDGGAPLAQAGEAA